MVSIFILQHSVVECQCSRFLGYSALLGGSPTVKENTVPHADDQSAENAFGSYFNKRLIALLKGNQLGKGLPQLIKDARSMLDALAQNPDGLTDPFDSIYRMVFKLTMRTVACNEIASDPTSLEKTLLLFEQLEGTSTPLSIMFPWLPTPAKFKRYYYGSQLYMVFKRVVDERKKDNRREDDALQYLLDQGDSIQDIILVSIASRDEESVVKSDVLSWCSEHFSPDSLTAASTRPGYFYT